MMGEPVGRQDRLFYEFDLEDMVPGDHLLRRIDAALDLSWLRGEMKAHYSQTRTFPTFQSGWIFGSLAASLQAQGDHAWSAASPRS